MSPIGVVSKIKKRKHYLRVFTFNNLSSTSEKYLDISDSNDHDSQMV